jgi:hypothetical protein
MWKKFEFEIDESGRHVKASLRLDGVLIIRTLRSHGHGKLDGNIPDQIRKQMLLAKGEFAPAIDCPMTAQEYHRLVRERAG